MSKATGGFGRNAGDVLAAILLVALVYVLIRPRSDGVALVTAFSALFVAVIRNAADLASTSSTSSTGSTQQQQRST